MRLDKFICNQTKYSRKEAASLVKRGAVLVNGVKVSDRGQNIDENKDEIIIDGEKIAFEEFVYYLLNKPQGYVSATFDNVHETVCDLVPKDREVAPVGRLDIDTEGLLLLTDDGKLNHELLSPKKHVDKTYYAKLDKEVTDSVVKGFWEGVDIGEDKILMPAKLEILGDGYEAKVTIKEGKFHQVKRMFEAFEIKVTFLKRLSMGKLTLPDDLPVGEYIKIKKEDII